jgi:hypothetical protein
MGEVRIPLKVKPICAVTFGKGIDLPLILSELEKLFGPVEDRSPVFDFSFTRYYQDEMGPDLKKTYCSFTNPVSPDALAGMKAAANGVERAWSAEGRRRVNIDPGYITGGKLVLASTKDFSHRVYLAQGIFGDVQLRYAHGKFHASEWTYPDYQTPLAMDFFDGVRKKLVSQEREHERIDAV